jgi:hypothetical protein
VSSFWNSADSTGGLKRKPCISDRICVVLGRDAGDEDHEFVAAEPGDRVALPDARAKAFRHPAQELVPDRMSERVVDDLRTGRGPQVQRRQRLAAPMGLRDRHAVVQEKPVGKSGQRVVEGEVLDT